jgi:hypothetical protein
VVRVPLVLIPCWREYCLEMFSWDEFEDENKFGEMDVCVLLLTSRCAVLLCLVNMFGEV